MRNTVAVLYVLVSTCLSQASPLPDYPFVFARGEARTKLAPDIARVSFLIKAFDQSAAKALSLVATRSTESLAILATNGVKKEDVVGFEIEKEAVRTRDKETDRELEITGYELSRRIEFTLRDLVKYDATVSALLKTPNVVEIRAEFDRTDRSAVEEKLLAQGVADGRHKAELMAKGSHQRIKTLKAISQQGFYDLGATFGLGSVQNDRPLYSKRPAEPQLLFVPATVEFSNSVSLIYEVEENK